MKNILKVTILFCLIILSSSLFCFASDDWANSKIAYTPTKPDNYASMTNVLVNGGKGDGTGTVEGYASSSSDDCYCFITFDNNSYPTVYGVSTSAMSCWRAYNPETSTVVAQFNSQYNSTYQLYYCNMNFSSARYGTSVVLTFSSYTDGFSSLRDYLDNPPPVYNKNPNVDEFIANTLISMGVKFDTPAYALSYASDAWNWCINEENVDSAHYLDEWNIDTFVSYCNAQSNNYLNWYNGYKLHEDVTKALGEYIRRNIRSLIGLPAGITSLQGEYLPIHHYSQGFQSGTSNPSANTFYPAQTITYFNGQFLEQNNNINNLQFTYTPPDVRRFLGYPATGSIVIPSDPAAGTGTITDDPNNPDQKNIDINFPSLDWLADAINSILDFLRNALTTLADLLTQLLDAILGLFSDAFAGLEEFGQGFIEFMQSVFAGFSDILSGFVPTDLATILITFLALNIGIGLITFVLKGH